MRAPDAAPGRQRGLSLIELMVTLVVALLVSLAAVASTQFVMGRQRVALDRGAAGGNESNALALIKHEVAQAGLGFFAAGRPLCPLMNLSQGATPFASASPRLPLQLSEDANGLAIEVLYASAIESVAPAPLAAPVAAGAGSLSVVSPLPVAAGQAVMLVPGPDHAVPCTVRTATAVTPAPADGSAPTVLDTGAGGAANQVAFDAADYTTDDFVSRLGELQWTRFRLKDGSLLMERPLAGTQAVVARNVVAFAADYGLAADGGAGPIADWQAPSGDFATPDMSQLVRVRALRIGLVMRSAQPDRRPGQPCAATTEFPTLPGRSLVPVDPDWACYHYRAATLVVPVRNLAP